MEPTASPIQTLHNGNVFLLIALNITRRGSLPLGRVGEGLQRGFEASYTLLYIYAREVAVVTVMTALTFVGTNGGGY